MAAMLGNMQQQGKQWQQPQANYGGGMQAPMQAWAPGQAQDLMAQLSAGGAGVPQARQGPGLGGGPMQAAPGAQDTMAQLQGGGFQRMPQGGMPQGGAPMPSFGAPGGGAGGGKGAAAQNPQLKQAIAQLPGGPPMGRPGMMGGPMGPVRRRQPGQGMMPQNPQMRR